MKQKCTKCGKPLIAVFINAGKEVAVGYCVKPDCEYFKLLQWCS